MCPNINSDPNVNDLLLFEASRELYDKVHNMGASAEEIKAIIKASNTKPKPIIPKFKFPACESEERRPPQPLILRLRASYNSMAVRDIDGVLICGDMPKKRVPGRILKLTKAVIDQQGQSNEEVRVLIAWSLAIIQYLLSSQFEPPKFGNAFEASLSKSIETFIREVIEYGQPPSRNSQTKALNP